MSHTIENTKISPTKSTKFRNNGLDDIKKNRPLPRNGFSAVATERGWFIIGGDRHRASFNDMWLLNKKAVEIYQ